MPKPPDWTDEEVALLKDNYYKLGAIHTAELFPNRSFNAIANKAKKLGLKSSKNYGTNWSPQEAALLKEVYTTQGGAAAAEALDRSWHSVVSKARAMGWHTALRGKGKVWTSEETSYLEKTYSKYGPHHCAKKLKRSVYGTRIKARALGLQFGMDPDYMNTKALAEAAGVAPESVKRVADRAGVVKVVHSRPGPGVKYGRKRCLVPMEWAEEYIESRRAMIDNKVLMETWYNSARVNKILGQCDINKDVVHHHAVMEVERKRVIGEDNGRGWWYNPWEIEALAKKVRENVAIISEEQLRILELLAEGMNIYRIEDDGHWQWWPMGKGIKQGEEPTCKKSAVTRLGKFGLIRGWRNGSLFITDRGREELEAHREG